MIPTTKLRFVERARPAEWDHSAGGLRHDKVRVLQQWWEWERDVLGAEPRGEWRDVPFEIEAL